MTRRILMCPPSHYAIAYEINPWMHRTNAPDQGLAMEQWQHLHDELASLGVSIEFVDQEPGLPDMTFTANAGLAIGNTFIPSNFRYPERQDEAAHFRRWFEHHAYRTIHVPPPRSWEGEGDVLWSSRGIFAGFQFRTEFAALDHIDKLLRTRTERLELVDSRFYHLDTCFCPLSDRHALFYPPAFSPEARARIVARFPDPIPVVEADALRFACNALVVDRTVVLNSGCAVTVAALTSAGFGCVETPMDEFIKAGGSVKCLALTLDGFTGIDAAVPPDPL